MVIKFLIYSHKVSYQKRITKMKGPILFFPPNCFAFSADLRDKKLVGSEFSCKPFLYYLPLATRPVIVVYNNTTML